MVSHVFSFSHPAGSDFFAGPPCFSKSQFSNFKSPRKIWAKHHQLSMCRENRNSLYRVTWNPNGAPCFAWKGPCFGGSNPQNRGQTGSRYIYIYTNISGWWLSFNPSENYATVKLDHFPKDRGEKNKKLNPPPRMQYIPNDAPWMK